MLGSSCITPTLKKQKTNKYRFPEFHQIHINAPPQFTCTFLLIKRGFISAKRSPILHHHRLQKISHIYISKRSDGFRPPRLRGDIDDSAVSDGLSRLSLLHAAWASCFNGCSSLHYTNVCSRLLLFHGVLCLVINLCFVQCVLCLIGCSLRSFRFVCVGENVYLFLWLSLRFRFRHRD